MGKKYYTGRCQAVADHHRAPTGNDVPREGRREQNGDRDPPELAGK
jgi:hypothetical protein